MKRQDNGRGTLTKRWLMLTGYDLLAFTFTYIFMLMLNPSNSVKLSKTDSVVHYALMAVSILGMRVLCRTYNQVWRYSRSNSYIRLMVSDVLGLAAYLVVETAVDAVFPSFTRMTIVFVLCIFMMNLLLVTAMRYAYTWLYEHSCQNHPERLSSRAILTVLRVFADIKIESKRNAIPEKNRIRIAIIGAGRIGAMLAEDLLSNPSATYFPVCFVDVSKEKIGREISGIRVLPEGENIKDELMARNVQEVVIAVQQSEQIQQEIFERYKNFGFKMKVYTFPLGSTSGAGKRQIREFGIDELLFRKQIDFLNDETKNYYGGKTVLISGGGGSIGAELARQIARMSPKLLVLLDIYENNVYDIQQELRLAYGEKINLAIEIASVRDEQQLDKVFRTYHPEVVLHAAAHKHVPLMEHNCSEAVKNNVFGTLNMVNVSEKYGVQKFIMVSTDKAVNPTNVMGASKRLCEMIVLNRAAAQKKTSFSCTRFGNVLGSNGSVIPLFKRQIANGGPITLTDRRIIRYFMTISEASQLVLTSGAMAKNGELFVLDMGKPVKILDLAENMIRLSGLEPYKDIDIVETGLRPGEKLYEELLIKTEKLTKTENEMIFIESDVPLSESEVEEKLETLRTALKSEDDDTIRLAMKKVVPTFHSPAHVNRDALKNGQFAREASGRGQDIA